MVSDAALPQLTDDGALLPLRCGQRVRLSCNPDCGDSFTMNNEVAVVVGAAGAIGSVITEQLVTAGLVVVAVGRDADKLQQLAQRHDDMVIRSEEHTSELQSLMRISYAVFCLKKKNNHNNNNKNNKY